MQLLGFSQKTSYICNKNFKFNKSKGDTTMKKNVTNQFEKDPLDPMTWDASQWKDAIIGIFYSVFIFAFSLFICMLG